MSKKQQHRRATALHQPLPHPAVNVRSRSKDSLSKKASSPATRVPAPTPATKRPHKVNSLQVATSPPQVLTQNNSSQKVSMELQIPAASPQNCSNSPRMLMAAESKDYTN